MEWKTGHGRMWVGSAAMLLLAHATPSQAKEPTAPDAFTAAFVSGVDRVCSAAWRLALTSAPAQEMTFEAKRALQTSVLEGGGFAPGAGEADVPNLMAMEAMGVPGKAAVSGEGQVYALIFGPKPECVIGGFGAPLRRAKAVAGLKAAGWTVSSVPEETTWLGYKPAGDANDTVLIVRTEEAAQPAPRTFRASVIAVPRSAIRPGVLEALGRE